MTGDLFFWIAVVVGFYMAWNIGANDVANAMGTSVGSGALTFKRAVIVAAIFEFLGAVLVGGSVTDTVRKGIVDPAAFASDPQLLVVGMCCALLSAALWLHLASWLGWPVSTTHSIVGAVAGFGIAAYGLGAVQWKTMFFIVMSWFVSPLVGGLLGFLVFVFIRNKILDTRSPIANLKKYGPLFVFPVFAILVLSFIYKGLKNLKLDLPLGQAAFISCGVGLLATLAAYWWVRRLKPLPDGEVREQLSVVEKNFIYLQILTACFVAFAHGSNDVANAVGPMAAVVGTLKAGVVAQKVELPIWVLVAGAGGIVVGLATYGHKVMATIGKNITEMSPSRGFSAEFGAAATILVGSKLGLPISTTHTLVGGVIGVGLARGIGALDMALVRKIGLSWIITVPFAGLLSAILYVIAIHTLI